MKRRETAIGAMLLSLSLAAVAVMLPSDAGAYSEAHTAKRVGTVTARLRPDPSDFASGPVSAEVT